MAVKHEFRCAGPEKIAIQVSSGGQRRLENPASPNAARKELGGEVLAIASDAGEVAGQERAAENIRQSFGSFDVLFLNAGPGIDGGMSTLQRLGIEDSGRLSPRLPQRNDPAKLGSRTKRPPHTTTPKIAGNEMLNEGVFARRFVATALPLSSPRAP